MFFTAKSSQKILIGYLKLPQLILKIINKTRSLNLMWPTILKKNAME
jgi:hypothetical protein